MELYIKNMVCNRCITAVKVVLEQECVLYSNIQLGKVELIKPITQNQILNVKGVLKNLGFELLMDKSSQVVEQIKNLIVKNVHYSLEPLKTNLSLYLITKLKQDYSVLSKLFSEKEKITIEHFYILQKIERVKELLVYKELTLSEIAFQLNYSSVAHLSTQFKKITGFTPTYFKSLKGNNRKQIDEL